MADTAYEAVVKNTFQTKPLRTVLMVDDQFPTFADLARGQTKETAHLFADTDRAVRLYESFQRCEMLCDIENVATAVKPDRIRKSDLVVLDFHLGPGLNDSDRAIEILRELSVSRHFNTVVVYTKEGDLDKVWMEILASISGDWPATPVGLAVEAQKHWDYLFDSGKIPEANKDVLIWYAKRRNIRDIPQPLRATVQTELVQLGVPAVNCTEIIEALAQRHLARLAGKYAKEARRITFGNCEGDQRWIQCGSVFIAIKLKGDLSDDKNDPGGILGALSSALSAWRPNLIQILVSEIQNILELEALASEDAILKDPVTHAALCYYLLSSVGPIDPNAAPDIKVPIMAVIDKIVDGVRRRLSTDPELLNLATQALLGELRDDGISANTWPKDNALLEKAITLARVKQLAKSPDVMFRLNSFFSTERFGRAHLTTGTIFRHTQSDNYFVATSPACDLVARPPSSDQSWALSIHPHTPLIAVLLSSVPVESALTKAAHGNHVFIEIEGDRKAFKIVKGEGYQPSYEILFLLNEGRVHERDGKVKFRASRLVAKNVDDGKSAQPSSTSREWIEDDFEIVSQLRGVNATHILQIVGQHLSRIGMDFISMPTGNP